MDIRLSSDPGSSSLFCVALLKSLVTLINKILELLIARQFFLSMASSHLKKRFPESGDTLQPRFQVSLNVLIVPPGFAFRGTGAEDRIGSQGGT